MPSPDDPAASSDACLRLQAEQLLQLQATVEQEHRAALAHRAALEQANAARDHLQKTVEQTQVAQQALQQEVDQLRQELARIYGSKSWRLTGILRALRRAIG